MKNKTIISCAIVINIILLLVMLYQKNRLITLQYERQALEQQLAELNEQQREIQRQLVYQSNPDSVLRRAQQAGFEPINLKQVRKL